MNKLNAKQLLTLPIGKYPDGNGLYLSIYKPKKGEKRESQQTLKCNRQTYELSSKKFQ